MTHGPLRLGEIMTEELICPITKGFSHAMSAQFAANAVRLEAIL